MVSLIQIFLYAEDMEAIFTSVAVALLPISYGIFLYLLLLPITTHMKKRQNKKISPLQISVIFRNEDGSFTETTYRIRADKVSCLEE